MSRLGQRMAQGGNDQPTRQRRFAEPHFALRRMHVDIDPFRRAGQKQHRRRVAVAAEKIPIGGFQRPDQQPVLHRAAIDKQILRHRRSARIARQRRIAGQPDAVALRIDRQGVFGEIGTDDAGKPPDQRVEQIALPGVGAKQLAAATA